MSALRLRECGGHVGSCGVQKICLGDREQFLSHAETPVPKIRWPIKDIARAAMVGHLSWNQAVGALGDLLQSYSLSVSATFGGKSSPMPQAADNPVLSFSQEEKELFAELVLQTVAVLYKGRGLRSLTPDTPLLGEDVGGRSVSADQELHLMFEYCGVTDVNDLLCFNSLPEARVHLLSHTESFGVDLSWVEECFFASLSDWSEEGWDHPFYALEPFTVPDHLKSLAQKFEALDYCNRVGDKVRWLPKIQPSLAAHCPSILHHFGEEALAEIRLMVKTLPDRFRPHFVEGTKKDDRVLESLVAKSLVQRRLA